ncbi:MAG: radical SAM protein [Candidatus Bathyarchaeia archaeon]
MKVLLVNPPRFNGIPVIREDRCEITERYSVLPPYSLLQIGAVLRRDGHLVDLVDANGFNLDYAYLYEYLLSKSFDVVIFRFTPTTFDNDVRIASMAKRIDPRIYTIGICWTLEDFAEQVLREAPFMDFYVAKESEIVVPNLINALENEEEPKAVDGVAYLDDDGDYIYTGKPSTNWEWESLSIPAFDLLPSLKPYYINTPHGKPFSIVYASKGCPYQCIFCTVARTKWRPKSAERIIEELMCLKKHFGVRLVSFFDETFTLDASRAERVASAISSKGLSIKWYCNTRVDLVDNGLWRTLYEGGCRGTSYGVESGSQKILDFAKKGFTVEQAEKAIKWAKDAGVKVYCSFIFGLPGENWQTILETLNFVKRTLPTGVQFNVAVPYPGTELYRIAEEKDWIKPTINWRNMYQHEAVMRTDELSYEDLNRIRLMAYRLIYFNAKWWMQNISHVMKHPDDFTLATRYVLKIVRNYLKNKMTHAH